MKLFKENDPLAQKFIKIPANLFLSIDTDREALYEGAYENQQLGVVLWNLNASPMVGVLTYETFIQAFYAIHDAFARPGTFEFYLLVIRAIFGNNVVVEFVNSTPGHLTINITAIDTGRVFFIAREIVNNAYVYSRIITSDNAADNIMFQVFQGIKTQAEIDALMYELSPNGIFVEANLIV